MSKLYTCAICGFQSTSTLRFKNMYTKDDKIVCKYCLQEWNKDIQKKAKKMTVDEIKREIADGANITPLDFKPTYEVEDFIQFDDHHKMWKVVRGIGGPGQVNLFNVLAIPTGPFPYKGTSRPEIHENGKPIELSNLGKQKVKKLGIKIRVHSEKQVLTVDIPITTGDKLKTTSLRYEYYIEIAQTILDAFEEHLFSEEKKAQAQQTTVINQVSAADELLKYKQLLDAGLITAEEFEQQKKALLS